MQPRGCTGGLCPDVCVRCAHLRLAGLQKHEAAGEESEGEADQEDEEEDQEGEGEVDEDDALDEDEAADVQLQQDIGAALSSLGDNQLDALFFAAVARFREDVLFGQEEARNSLLMSACVQHPEFMEEVDRLRNTNARVEGRGTATSPLQLLSDAEDESNNGEGAGEESVAGGAGSDGGGEDGGGSRGSVSRSGCCRSNSLMTSRA